MATGSGTRLGAPVLHRCRRWHVLGQDDGQRASAELTGDTHLALIKLDSYYVERTHQPFEERAAANYDHPDAFDWQLLNDHIAALAAGAPVPVPIYDYTIHDRSGDVRMVHPAQIVVVEGILVLYEPTLRERFDLKVYIDTDADLRLIRRLHRDVTERGRTHGQHHHPVPDDGAAEPRAVHRAEQAPRRRDLPAGRDERAGARRVAREGSRAGARRGLGPRGRSAEPGQSPP